MNLFGAIILGIVEGITEFLPISSTGHLILASAVLKLQQSDFLKSFEIVIQLGAILSVVFLYWRKLFIDRKIFMSVVVAFLPTAILGLVFYKFIKTYLLGSSTVVLWALFLGGVGLIGFELMYDFLFPFPQTCASPKASARRMRGGEGWGGDSKFNTSPSSSSEEGKQDEELLSISYKKCFFIGLFQSIAMIPGVSRAAATIIGGLALGIKRKTIVEFSFLLAVPTMAAATGLDLIKSVSFFKAGDFYFLAVGFIISFITALLAIKFLLAFIKKHNFIWFGVYRITLAAVFWMLI